ncbi:hypothetical protein [Pelomonas sp. Root662]|uniref:hypothetical protein n=1 Tax=Pelomonas sp. Root662 TaxID=1736580 RepID=UPI0012F83A90|nr:hypothetical protein [Pelomonas sp. Root662]
MYGKALCLYLQSHLPGAGINVPSFNNEDWGWWVDLERGGFKMGLCVYSDPTAINHPERYALLPSIQKAKTWSWSKLRSVDASGDVLGLVDTVESVLKADKEIPVVTRHDDYPFD